MLLSFRAGNHRSMRDEQQLRMSPVYDADRPEGTQLDAVPVVALFGANASGKSNVVDALRFMTRMVRASHRDAEPGGGIERYPFALDQDGLTDPSWYVVDLLLEGVRHTYGFSVDSERVVDEWLYSYPLGRKRKIFHRNGDDFEYGDGTPKRELDLIRTITEPNTLFISIAARSKQELIQPVYAWFLGSVLIRAGGSRRYGVTPATVSLLEDPKRSPAVVDLLRAADLGIENAGVERVTVAEDYSPGLRRVRETRPRSVEGQEALFGDETSSRLRGAVREVARVWIEQRGRKGAVRLDLRDQSEGTRILLDYAGPVLRTLERGGLLVIDEVDASLHPRLTAHLIRLFQQPDTNSQGAQLLLTTHDASLLGRSAGEDILKRDQVWFVEKDEHGETSLFPLSDFKPRQDENRERRYLGGSYGAVPFLNDERFTAAVVARGESDAENAEA